MSMLSNQADELRTLADRLRSVRFDDQANYIKNVETLHLSMIAMREAACTIISLRDRLQESYGQVPELGKCENEDEHESCGEVCGDDRFELIDKAKEKLLECTNIESRPEEVAVLDSILFRCWQMGWLDQLCDSGTRWHQLFGTPERAARTLAKIPCDGCCESCSLYGAGCDYYGDGQLEWLRGDA